MSKQTQHSQNTIREILHRESQVLHFVGIGGVSMSSLAHLSLKRGHRVTGSDRILGKTAHALAAEGATVHAGHDGSYVSGASAVIYSHAISENNPEMLCARSLGIPTVSRADMLGAIMLDYRTRIGVSGTHGKSTVVSMLDRIFSDAALRPTVLSGSVLTSGNAYRDGENSYLIYEACEYRDSFLSFAPSVAIALNLEMDHPDYFESIEAIKSSFTKAIDRASIFAVINGDDGNLADIVPKLKCRTVTYGEGEHTDYRYLINSFDDKGYSFTLYRYGTAVSSFSLNMIGVYNVSNVTAAIVTALELGIDIESIRSSVARLGNIPQRLELVGSRHGRAVYYDYAHHPTAIEANINALHIATGDAVTVIFKPHTYSRTKALWDDFVAALSLADHLVLTEIYPAREEPMAGVNSRRLAEDVGGRATFLPDHAVAEYVDLHTLGTIVIMGAGDTEQIKNNILS